jgi:crossover junction endodeoxyribonuclease RusA
VLDFFVAGIPQPQGSKTVFLVRNRAGKVVGSNVTDDNDKVLRPWRRRVQIRAHNAMKGRPPMDGAITVVLGFTLHRPVNTPKSRTPHAIKKPDLDKLVRACFDAMSGVCYHDDSQVVELVTYKKIAELHQETGARIQLAPMVLQLGLDEPEFAGAFS